jgi:antitoxin component YwqK of YwqJK toxin-antitoxin module
MADTPEPFEKRHRNGSLWARGQMLGGAMTGYWEFFRKDGTLLRAGHFENGRQTGDWTTFDRSGAPYKTTRITPKS